MGTLRAGFLHSDSGEEHAKWEFEKGRLVEVFDGDVLLISIELTDLLALAMAFDYVYKREEND